LNLGSGVGHGEGCDPDPGGSNPPVPSNVVLDRYGDGAGCNPAASARKVRFLDTAPFYASVPLGGRLPPKLPSGVRFATDVPSSALADGRKSAN
jgi:hypothetical protein